MRIPPALLTHLRSTFALDWCGIHGASHWARFLGTAAARRPEVIRWAYEWSTRVMRTAS